MITCWFCEALTDIEDTDFGDHFCKNCGVMISVYNPNKPDWKPEVPVTTNDEWLQNKEEEMPFEKQEASDSVYVKLPKEGKSYDFSQHGEVTKIEKVANPDKSKGFNFIKKIKDVTASGKEVMVDDDQGYFYRIEFSDGKKLSLASWSPFFAIRDAEITEGDKFSVDHPSKGKWIVEKK